MTRPGAYEGRKDMNMTTTTMILVVIGVATCTSWVFKLVDIIEKS